MEKPDFGSLPTRDINIEEWVRDRPHFYDQFGGKSAYTELCRKGETHWRTVRRVEMQNRLSKLFEKYIYRKEVPYLDMDGQPTGQSRTIESYRERMRAFVPVGERIVFTRQFNDYYGLYVISPMGIRSYILELGKTREQKKILWLIRKGRMSSSSINRLVDIYMSKSLHVSHREFRSGETVRGITQMVTKLGKARVPTAMDDIKIYPFVNLDNTFREHIIAHWSHRRYKLFVRRYLRSFRKKRTIIDFRVSRSSDWNY